MLKETNLSAGQLSLITEEVELLAAGLMEWSGPARCTDEFAVAMGFSDAVSLPRDCIQIRSTIMQDKPLSPMDWARALLATEISFVSDMMGSGVEWSTTTGWDDGLSIRTLRGIQRKLVRTVMPLIGQGLGTRIPEFSEPVSDVRPRGRGGVT
jgi:hypothetical protein